MLVVFVVPVLTLLVFFVDGILGISIYVPGYCYFMFFISFWYLHSCIVLLDDGVGIRFPLRKLVSHPANGKMPRLVWNPKLRHHVTKYCDCTLPQDRSVQFMSSYYASLSSVSRLSYYIRLSLTWFHPFQSFAFKSLYEFVIAAGPVCLPIY